MDDPFAKRAAELVDFIFNSPISLQKHQCDGCKKFFGLPNIHCDEGDTLICNSCLQGLWEEMRNEA